MADPRSSVQSKVTITPDYVLVGHVAHDVTPHGPQLGGTVSYAAHTAAAFGLRVGILTSSAPGEPLLDRLPPDTLVISIPAEHTTTFENRYTPGQQREQFLHHRAATLRANMLPDAWLQAPLAHLGPIAYEIEPGLMGAFAASRVCVTPQGWMRSREPDGHVATVPWLAAQAVLSRAALTILSREDIRHDPSLEAVFARYAPLLVVTDGMHGGAIYRGGQRATFPAIPITEVEPTGAGDIFATALHIALARLHDVGRAVRIAAYLAGLSVSRRGFASAPTADEIAAAWAQYAPDDPAPPGPQP